MERGGCCRCRTSGPRPRRLVIERFSVGVSAGHASVLGNEDMGARRTGPIRGTNWPVKHLPVSSRHQGHNQAEWKGFYGVKRYCSSSYSGERGRGPAEPGPIDLKLHVRLGGGTYVFHPPIPFYAVCRHRERLPVRRTCHNPRRAETPQFIGGRKPAPWAFLRLGVSARGRTELPSPRRRGPRILRSNSGSTSAHGGR